MSPKISKELAKHRLEQAKENLEEAEILYNVKTVSYTHLNQTSMFYLYLLIKKKLS